MLVDTEHLHYWMQAIRQSPDPLRTMDAFWSGQLRSKEWLISNLAPFIKIPVCVDIHGGWVGVLASLFFQSGLPVDEIRSIDVDSDCAATAIMMNKNEEIAGKFTALTADMCEIESDYPVIINTSCEHLTQEQYSRWLSKQDADSLLVVQSNNYDIPEHLRIANSLEEFHQQSDIDIWWSGQLVLPLYTRYMIIGQRNV